MMTGAKTSKKKNSQNKKALYVILALLGVAFIGVLVLLNIKFHKYMRFSSNGDAVITGTLSENLSKNPTVDEIKESLNLYEFEALEYLYNQKDRYYLGEKKKTQVDCSYPVYINDGTSLLLVNSSSKLIDENYEDVDTYSGMMLNEGHTYNPDGEQADAATYFFLKMTNGNYALLMPVSYNRKGINYTIPANSMIYFGADYFTYYSYVEGELCYGYCDFVPADFELIINEEKITYEELRIKLGLYKKMKEKESKEETTAEASEEETTELITEPVTDSKTEPVIETETESKTKPEKITTEEDTTEEKTTEETTEEETTEAVVETTEEVTTETETVTETDTATETISETESATGSKETESGTTKGVRPDDKRPDKNPDDKDKDKKPKDPEYIKPVVTVGELNIGVYRITAPLSVKDSAKRIDKSKQIQFMIYEVLDNGKETLRFRSYYKSTTTITLGNGMIEPGKKYHIVGFFTYSNEFSEATTEYVLDTTVRMKDFSSLNDIVLSHKAGTSYSSHAEIADFGIDTGSDEEAVYGVAANSGILITLKEQGSDTVVTSMLLSASQIKRFKNLEKQILTTASVLKAKTTYVYTIELKDYFGNVLPVKNGTGTYTTSNNPPSATFSLEKNEIGNVVIKTKITDRDAAAVLNEAGTGNDVYFVVSTRASDLEDISELTSEEVAYWYKLNDDEYSFDAENGLSADLILPTLTKLKLDKKYFVSIYCDYDLSNGEGPVRFKSIGQMNFTSAGLSSLGRVYVETTFQDIGCDFANIAFKLNTRTTNAQLISIIKEMKVTVTPKGATEPDAIIGFDADDTVNLNGEEVYVYDQFKQGNSVAYTANNLRSMTDYTLALTIIAEYEGERIELISSLNQTAFKTLRLDAEVVVTDLVFTGGTIDFDVIVNDPDDAITGNSGDKVVVNLYTSNGTFVKALRIKKNEKQNVVINSLDIETTYQLRFIAVEYNVGYDNLTLESNKVLKTVEVENSLKIDGTIRLQDIKSIEEDDTHLNAIVKTVINDPTGVTIGKDPMPYYIKVYKDGQVISDTKYFADKEIDQLEQGILTHYYEAAVDKGDHTYKYVLYVVISKKEIKLSSIEFTTECEVKGFATAYEMIKYIKADPDGKFVATDNIDYYSDSSNKHLNPKDITIEPTDSILDVNNTDQCYPGNTIVGNFFGQIDFQGFEFNEHYYVSGSRIFTNLGSGSSIKNMVFNVYLDELNAKINDDGVFCYRNFGTISNIQLNYMGGKVLAHYASAVLARVNSSSGIIENFVINNKVQPADSELSAFTASQYVGIISCDNYGIIRYGYVYGENVYAVPSTNLNFDRKVSAICGTNQTIGSIYSVYCLVNVDIAPSTTDPKLSDSIRYDGVCGYSGGSLSNIYAIGMNSVIDNKTNQDNPICGQINGKTHDNLFYWNADGYKYKSNYAKLIGVDTLYDKGWHLGRLTSNFDCDPVDVGFYPQVIMPDCMPEQEYNALPAKVNKAEVTISQVEILSNEIDADANQSATAKFVFSNPNNMDIMGVTVADVSVVLDLTTTTSEDGYTTIYGTIFNPQKFRSSYDVEKITYVRKGKTVTVSSDYTIYVNFYRLVYTAEDWYNYVVLPATNKTCENVKLMKDIDFDGILSKYIIVTGSFSAVLDGNNHVLSNIDLQKEFKFTNDSTARRLFNGSIPGGAEVKNLVIKDYKCGGVYVKNNNTFVSPSAAVFGTVEGSISNIHVVGINAISYGYFAGLVVNVLNGAEVVDCSVSPSEQMGVELICKKPTYASSNACIGGIVSKLENSRLSNCFVREVDIQAIIAKGSDGIGGVVGYANQSVIDTAYATGKIEARANKIGGIVGRYYASSASIICVKNVISKVNILNYTDVVGNIIGLADLTSDMITATNNVSGIALGDVYCFNPDSVNVSHTVGQITGKNMSFYGSDLQLINGQLTASITDNEVNLVRGLLTYEDLSGSNAWNTYRRVIGFDNVYQINDEGTLPKMYYYRTTTVMPFQEEDILITKSKQFDFDITGISVDTNSYLMVVTVNNPKEYEITGVNIEELEFTGANALDGTLAPTEDFSKAIDTYRGVTKIYLKYKSEQNHFKDSYVLDQIKFVVNGVEQNYETSARVPLTLYRSIYSVEDWNKIPAYPEYENYKLEADLDFTSKSCATNLNIGRLVSDYGYSISNITLTNQFLISNLNSGLKNIKMYNITVSSKNLPGVAIIGVNNGCLTDCEFSDIKITATNNTTEMGIFAHMNGGIIKNIDVSRVTLSGTASTHYVGSLIGNLADIATVNNITASNISITNAGSYVGGVFGWHSNGNIDGVTATDIDVTASGSTSGNVGGIYGRLGANNNSSIFKANNITILGTESYDDEGKVSGSTTIICCTGGYSNTGAIAGATYMELGVNSESAPHSVIATGVYVKSKGSQVGGAFGYAYTNVDHVYVENSLIEAELPDSDTTNYTYVGGIAGYLAATLRFCEVDNIYIKSVNRTGVGGMVGTNTGYNVNSIVRNVTIDAKTTKTENRNYGVGGYSGYATSTMYYIEIINTKINAPTMTEVGGIVGRMGNGITSGAQLYRSYYLAEFENTAAKDTYLVHGYDRVGGIIGYQYGSQVHENSSNANVVAEGNGSVVAGGLVGLFDNSFTTATNGKKTYANTSLYKNIFSGKVTSSGYAGGAIGRTSILLLGLDKTTGAVFGNGSRIKNITGSNDESAYNYNNLIVAETVKGINGKTSYFAADDATYKGKQNYIFEGIKLINGDAISYASESGLQYFRDKIKSIKSDNTGITAIRLVKTDDFGNGEVTGTDGKSKYGIVLYRYLNLGLMDNSGFSDRANRNYYYRFFIDGCVDKYDNNQATVGNYLPQIRRQNATSYSKDGMLKNQDAVGRIPIPNYVPANAISNDTLVPETLTYAIAYAVEANRINIEFSENLLGNNYKIFIGDTLVKEGQLEQRVFTLPYNFDESIRITYGESNPDKEVKYEAKALSNEIMVFNNYYYYIDDGALVYGDSFVENKNDEHKYVNLYNGKALDDSGKIWSVTNFTEISSENVEGETLPLFRYRYNDSYIDTYGKFSQIITGENVVTRNEQIILSDNELYSVSAAVDKQESGVIIYTQNGKAYEMILGKDGIIAELLQGSVSIPEKVPNRAIVRMTNIYNASVPYLIIQYADNGIVCCNYLTKEIVFDRQSDNVVSVGEYISGYFSDKEVSNYAKVFASFAANKMASDNLHSSLDIDRVINDEKKNENETITINSDNKETASGDREEASGDREEASVNETIIEETDSVEENTKETEEVSSSEITKEDSENTIEETSEEAVEKETTAEENNEETVSAAEEENTSSVKRYSTVTDETYRANQVAKNKKSYVTLYNSNVESYQIVEVASYLTNEKYVSENERVNVSNLATIINNNSGYATATSVDKNTKRGIFFFVLAVVAIGAITGSVIIGQRKRR